MAAPPDRAGVIEDSLRGGRFRFKTRPFRDRAVPFDERRDRPCSGDDAFEQAPDRVGDGPVVAVDEQRLALVVALFGMSGEMDFADEPKRIIRQIVERREAVVGSRHEDVVDVEQEAAAGAARDGADEIRLAHCRFPEQDIGRRIFEQQRSADRLLHFVDMVAHRRERRFGVGQRKQVVEIYVLVRRPGQMLGDERGLVATNKVGETGKMRLVQGLRGADRHAHAMQRKGMVAADGFERAMRRAAAAHVVLGVNLEKAARLPPRDDRLQVLGLEACPGQSRDRMRRKARLKGCPLRICGQVSVHRGPRFPALACRRWLDYMAVREPCLPFGSSIDAQVPPWTNFHELPWKSTVEVPWQVVPGPAAQSFWPLRATPKHFSLWAAMAAAFSASVNGPAEASVASALDRALARTSEVMAVFADIGLLRIAGWPSLGTLGLRGWSRERYFGC